MGQVAAAVREVEKAVALAPAVPLGGRFPYNAAPQRPYSSAG